LLDKRFCRDNNSYADDGRKKKFPCLCVAYRPWWRTRTEGVNCWRCPWWRPNGGGPVASWTSRRSASRPDCFPRRPIPEADTISRSRAIELCHRKSAGRHDFIIIVLCMYCCIITLCTHYYNNTIHYYIYYVVLVIVMFWYYIQYCTVY